jgi:two-component system response regulator VicR
MPKKYTIMTVDNEPDTVELVKLILENAGYKVVTALSGKECLKKLRTTRVDLILLDMMMPEMSGWDVYERIRKEGRKPDIKVAFLSVIDISPTRMEKLKKEGIADNIPKPFTPDELVRKVKAMLGE